MVVVAADGDSSDDQNCPRTPAAADYSDEKAEGVVVVVGENKVADRNFPEEGSAVVAPTLEGEGGGGERGGWWVQPEGRLVAGGA